MVTLVSVVGAKKAGYETCTYEFDDGGQFQTCLFGYAVLQRLKKSNDPARKWILLGTATSDWHVLHAICGESGLQPTTGNAWETLTDEVVGGGASQATLDRIGEAMSLVMACHVRPRIIENDADSVFSVLHEEVPKDAAVVLDITHGYRTIPMYCVLALGALRWMKGVTLTDLLYGQLEGNRGAGKPAPGVSLRQGVALAEMAPLAAKVAIADDLNAAADVCERLGVGDAEDRAFLRRQALQDSLLFGDLAHAERQKLASRLVRWNPAGTGIANLAAGWIRDVVGAPGGFPANHHFKRADEFCRRGDYLRALLLLVDAYRLEIVRWGKMSPLASASDTVRALELAGARPEMLEDIRALNTLRNSSAHGDQRKRGRASELRGDPERSVAFIRSMVKRFPNFRQELAELVPTGWMPSIGRAHGAKHSKKGKGKKRRKRNKGPDSGKA